MIDLAHDIRAILSEHARGASHAIPRRELIDRLHALGRNVSDRALRRAYAEMPEVGSSLKGIFLIVTAEDRAVARATLHSPAMAELVREKRVREGGEVGQGVLFT